MGLITAAAKLGFRLTVSTSNKKIIRNNTLSLITRRSTTSVVATTDIVAKKEKSSTNLYLCFDERASIGCHETKTNLVVHPIQLDSYCCIDPNKEEELRKESAYKSFSIQDIVTAPRCIRLGSKILFGIGNENPKDICWVDPLSRPVKFHISSPTETKIKSFTTNKFRMAWGVIDGKIYCFDDLSVSYGSENFDEECQHFEVLDPKTDDTKWQPLSGPPFIRGDRGTYKYSVLFLNDSKKILGWEDEKTGVFFFDATKPENGWERSPPGLQNSVPFSGLNSTKREDGLSVSVTTLVIRDNHPKLGDFNLVFAYNTYDEPFLISPFFISDNCDSFQSISGTILLPKETCSKYTVDYFDAKGSFHVVTRELKFGLANVTRDSQFVNLGANKFCLILHKFFEKDSDDKTRGIVLVLTFEYELIVSDGIKLKTRLYQTRRFKYRLAKSLKKNMPSSSSYLIGAYSF